MSGFSSTCRCVSAEPMALTMPSPTRAMIVSSVAPPTRRSRLVRTVTLALTLSWMPFLATPSIVCRPERRVGAGDHLGVDAGLHGLEHVAARQVDRRGSLVRQRDVGAVGGDQRPHDVRHVAAGQVVSLEARGRHAVLLGQAGLVGHDLRADDDVRVHLAERHPDQLPDRRRWPGSSWPGSRG